MPQTPGTWHVPLRAAPIKREGCFVIALTVNVRPMPWIRHSGHHSQHLRHGVRCFRKRRMHGSLPAGCLHEHASSSGMERQVPQALHHRMLARENMTTVQHNNRKGTTLPDPMSLGIESMHPPFIIEYLMQLPLNARSSTMRPLPCFFFQQPVRSGPGQWPVMCIFPSYLAISSFSHADSPSRSLHPGNL